MGFLANYEMKPRIIGLSLIIALTITMIAVIVFVGPIDVSKQEEEDKFKDWNKSGPFGIDQKEYQIGEMIFMTGEGLMPNDIGNAIFILPNGTSVYMKLPFNGENKADFNYYFKPQLSKNRGICSTDDIIGKWMIEFDGTKYQPITFTILNQTDPTEVGLFQKVC